MTENTKSPARDTFLYLLSIITLVGTAVSLGVLLFQYINIYFPDPLNDYYQDVSFYQSSIRTALSAIVILFPVYFWVSRFIRKDILANPEKRELKVRKWLLYLTLFAASLVIIGDLVALVNNYLQGEITARFVLKVLSVLFIAGSAFYYYLHQLREEAVSQVYKMSRFAGVISVIILAVIGWGFYVAGSPQSQRLIRFDQRRVSDLQSLQFQIIDYWQRKRALPSNLEALKNDITGYRAPVDPETGQAYEYKAEGQLMFSLCANFETVSQSSYPGAPASVQPVKPYLESARLDNWAHDKGHQCFSRKIDPDLYPPITKP